MKFSKGYVRTLWDVVAGGDPANLKGQLRDEAARQNIFAGMAREDFKAGAFAMRANRYEADARSLENPFKAAITIWRMRNNPQSSAYVDFSGGALQPRFKF